MPARPDYTWRTLSAPYVFAPWYATTPPRTRAHVTTDCSNWVGSTTYLAAMLGRTKVASGTGS